MASVITVASQAEHRAFEEAILQRVKEDFLGPEARSSALHFQSIELKGDRPLLPGVRGRGVLGSTQVLP